MSTKATERRARELHRRAIVIDCHSDILIPVMEGKMRLGERVDVPDPATWRPPHGMTGGIGAAFGFSAHTNYFGPMGQYDLPRPGRRRGYRAGLRCLHRGP